MRASEHFLVAIRASPDDDAPRLVYADWLEERGDVRGEFIAIQCALVGMAEDAEYLTKLRELGLSHNKLRRAREFTHSPYLTSLRALDLRKNLLDEEARAQLRHHFGKRVRL